MPAGAFRNGRAEARGPSGRSDEPGGIHGDRARRRPAPGSVLVGPPGVLPFFLFAFFFLILPTSFLIVGAFQDAEGRLTLANFRDLFHPTILKAYWISIQVSAASAIGGAILGFFVAYAAISGGLPRWVRPTLLTFSGVASNFAGVPLAFAFLATLGRMGLVTVLLVNLFDFNIYRTGFNLLSFWGLALTYMYFQIPLMVLIMAPAIDGLRARVARGGVESRRQRRRLLAVRRAARALAHAPRDHSPPVRQCLRRQSRRPTR